MRDRLIELLEIHFITKLGTRFHREVLENIADYLLENGVIVPPCKVGDVLYLITDCSGDMRRTVTGFTQDYILSYAMQIPMSELGKTVFLTREGAEQALKGAERK